MSAIIVWLRQDLRLQDQAAIHAALATSKPIIFVYVWEEGRGNTKPLGKASKQWLRASLAQLSKELEHRGGSLVFRAGKTDEILTRLAEETNSTEVYWNRCYVPEILKEDQALEHLLKSKGIQVRTFRSFLLLEPWTFKTLSGGSYQKFSAFWNSFLSKVSSHEVTDAPRHIRGYGKTLHQDVIDDYLPDPKNESVISHWVVGEAGAAKQLASFIKHDLPNYKMGREYPGRAGTSLMSPFLFFGEISPNTVFRAILQWDGNEEEKLAFLRELAWREFHYHLLFYHQEMGTKNIHAMFDHFEWDENEAHFIAWTEGQTGYPIVDAGMRQLKQTGFMHNRVRMIVASFLTKHVRIQWQKGEAWFWEHLVDADPANNPANWQWIAGSGMDAAPYFRIFNPILQGEKFDTDGAYVRKYVPELAKLPNEFIQKPWMAPIEIRLNANVLLGTTYPAPLVDHQNTRQISLHRYQMAKQSFASTQK